MVLDDIWFIEHWNCLKPAFPLNDDCCASKVLVTTRDSEIFSFDPSHVVYYYKAEFLNLSQSWELLEKKANFNKDNAGTLCLAHSMYFFGSFMLVYFFKLNLFEFNILDI